MDLRARHWTPKRLPLALASLLAVLGLLCVGPPALAAADPVTERFTVPVDLVAPPHDCINESVQWTGSYDVTLTSLQDGSGAWHWSITYVQRLTGVGLDTGQSYLQVGTYHETLLDSPVVWVHVFPDVYLEISLGAGGNYVGHSVELQVNHPEQGNYTEQDLGSDTCAG